MADEKNAREKLVEKARTEYGIANAEDISDKQLKQEMKDLDAQRPENQPKEAKSSDTQNTTKDQTAKSNL